VAQGLAEDAEDAAVVAQGLAEDAQAAAEAVDAYTKAEADAITDPIAADVATNTADIATNASDIATNAADIATNTSNISTLDSNKIEDERQSWGTMQYSAITSVAPASGEVNVDLWTASGYSRTYLNQNVVVQLPSNPADGMVWFHRLINNASYFVSYDAAINWGVEDVPVMPVGAGEELILGFLYAGGEVKAWEVWRSV